MTYSVFPQHTGNALKEPMFLGNGVNVARYDVQKLPVFEKLIEKQISFFWRPEEVDLSQDRIDFQNLPAHEKHIFLSNLKYQTLLDSIQGRSPNIALLPIISLPELETWVETWSFFETIHSRSYTHIIRNILNDPSEVFDEIMHNEAILKRAERISSYYDKLIEYTSLYSLGKLTPDMMPEFRRRIYMTLMCVNALEAIRFYVSFACSFAFAERSVMEGNAKVIKFIARDEALHLSSTQHMLQMLGSGEEGEEWKAVAEECAPDSFALFAEVSEQEKEWAAYLFKDGSMIGLTKEILCSYVEYITNLRMQALGFPTIYDVKSNPIPWINAWLSSDNVQVAPQEVEIASYLTGQIDSNLEAGAFDDMTI